MRPFSMLIAATLLASPLLISAGEFSPAEARMSLGQCISKEKQCRRNCLLGLNGMEAVPETFQALGQCFSNCSSNHSACVDFSMGQISAVKAESSGKPPKGTNTPLGGGLLETSQGFATQGPAATGSPLQARPAGAGPLMVR
jgi:hypothetical protein